MHAINLCSSVNHRGKGPSRLINDNVTGSWLALPGHSRAGCRTHQLWGDVYVKSTVGLQEPKYGVEEVQRHGHLGCVLLLGRHLDGFGGLGEIDDVTSYALHDGLQGQETGHGRVSGLLTHVALTQHFQWGLRQYPTTPQQWAGPRRTLTLMSSSMYWLEVRGRVARVNSTDPRAPRGTRPA